MRRVGGLFTSPTSLTDGRWHDIAITYDGAGTGVAYADGAQVGTPMNIGAQSTTMVGRDVVMGTDRWSGYLQGGLDEVAIYSTALSASRIAAHYQGGAPYQGPFGPAQAGTNGSNCAGAGGNPHGNTTGNGGHEQFTYDGSHRVTVMADAQCFATAGCPGVQNHYNASGQVDWQKDQLNRQTTFGYNSDGSTTVTDPNGNVVVDYYNQGLRIATTRGYGTPQAATWSFGYDPATLALTETTDPNGNSVVNTVDGNGNVLTSTDAMSRVTTMTYNGFNEPLTIENGNGVTTTNTYDTRGNLTSTARPLVGSTPTGHADHHLQPRRRHPPRRCHLDGRSRRQDVDIQPRRSRLPQRGHRSAG